MLRVRVVAGVLAALTLGASAANATPPNEWDKCRKPLACIYDPACVDAPPQICPVG